jgi:sugar phosphate permease
VSLEERAFRKATRRLIPFLFLIYVVAYLDRVNVSFAQLQLEDDLGFSDTIFGIGAGIFSLGYVIFRVPSNLALERFGARRWLAGIMMVWGLISASMMFIGGATSFYVLRFLLGAAEAGFFPGSSCFSRGGSPSASARGPWGCSSRRCLPPTWRAARCPAACSSWTASPGSTGGSGCS